MTVGALLFAFDSEIKYTKLAVECATRIKKYLDIPVSLVTDINLETDVFDQQIIVDKPSDKNKKYHFDLGGSSAWYNFGRNCAIDHTPYDRTLLVDTDYMVNSADLSPMLECEQPFLAHRSVQEVFKNKKRIDRFGTKNTQMWWATVIIFDKSTFSQDVFAVWKMVEQNYHHYSNIFGFDSRKFRNDFALSISLLLCNGNTIPTQCDIPWPLFNVDPDIKVELLDNKWWIEHTTRRICMEHHDLHVMGKTYLENLYAV
jgi:hypothetical protein